MVAETLTEANAQIEEKAVDIMSSLVYQCHTPSGKKAFGELSDNHDGTFTLDVNVTESGTHTVNIEMGGKKIPGSPFFVRILQQADRNKVHIHGCGLESGVLGDFEGVFHVDTNGAGPGELKVRIHGPKEGVGVSIDRSDRVINVTYNANVAGIYTVNIYWSGEHVEGSPCEIYVAPDSDSLQTWIEQPGKIREKEGLLHL